MSYLGPLRLHFSGQFQADPSTVNNDVRHFNNATFQPNFQQPQSETDMNGWWQPEGSGAFRLVGCKVTMVSYSDGTTSTSDPVVGMSIADASSRVAGRIVDLDPQQQLVSELWGLLVRLTDGSADSFAGPFEPASFSDIWWARAKGPGGGGDIGAGSFYQSVIGPVTWGDGPVTSGTSGSRFLRELRDACPAGLLSIKFNVDGYNMSPTSPQFTLGRLVGTIGPASPPASPDEPKHFVLGRQLLPQVNHGSPSGAMNFMPAVVDVATQRVIADFGNALPTMNPGGPLMNLGDLELGYLDAANAFHSLGAVEYQQPNWYPLTGGVQAFPPDRTLTADELTTLKTSRIAVAQNGTVVVEENLNGLYLRADQFTFRIEPGDRADVHFWATEYGNPLPDAKLMAYLDDGGLQPGSSNPADGLGAHPTFGVPESALTFDKRLTTDAHGRATLSIAASDPGNPRGYIDGQVYGIRYFLNDVAKQVTQNLSFGYNHSDFLSVLVFDAYAAPAKPTWYDLLPMFQQYGNLYPLMDRILDLSSYDAVAANAHLLAFSFGLQTSDPNYMPVVRDLSRGKREAIVYWLTHPGADGKPLLGEPPAPRPTPPPAAPPPAAALPHTLPRPAGAPHPSKGAKTFAGSTRRGVRLPDDIE
jgi:hypothetical protein